MTTETYFDIHNLALPTSNLGGCPVAGCDAPLGEVDSQWGEMPYCPVHRIRIHANSRTFAYYNGADATSKREAVLRNILFERQYFKDNILDNPKKAETHRMGHETSEDALTWNVFSRLAQGGFLPKLLSTLTNSNVKSEPELYLWGIRVGLNNSSTPSLLNSLNRARHFYEKGISKFLTEPDIMLYIPGQLLVLVEAKFTSGNTIASNNTTDDLSNEKPKSREGILKRYPPTALSRDALLVPPSSEPFYSQLYRNLVFARHMAKELGVKWGLVNLVSEEQFHKRENKVEFKDPTPFIHSCLPEESHKQFLFYSWERLYADHVAKATGLNDLAEYMRNKSANGIKALAV